MLLAKRSLLFLRLNWFYTHTHTHPTLCLLVDLSNLSSIIKTLSVYQAKWTGCGQRNRIPQPLSLSLFIQLTGLTNLIPPEKPPFKRGFPFTKIINPGETIPPFSCGRQGLGQVDYFCVLQVYWAHHASSHTLSS